MSNPVEQLKNEYKAIEKYLLERKELLLTNDLNKHLRKILILSAGSYFEREITTILSDFVRSKSNEDERIVNFLEKQAISGKYFQLFDWGKQNQIDKPGKGANKFFGLFGDVFKKQAISDIEIEESDTEERKMEKKQLREAIDAFIEIGHVRNILVHSNFAEYTYEQKTADEIFTLFQTAELFLDYLKKKLK
ncbi:MAG: hypothetical protein LBG80_08325 [Bacteroidales bacterium]|jgi:hypothetical protein|nr:hypothetical protein [Bacteroidales bacterium]